MEERIDLNIVIFSPATEERIIKIVTNRVFQAVQEQNALVMTVAWNGDPEKLPRLITPDNAHEHFSDDSC